MLLISPYLQCTCAQHTCTLVLCHVAGGDARPVALLRLLLALQHLYVLLWLLLFPKGIKVLQAVHAWERDDEPRKALQKSGTQHVLCMPESSRACMLLPRSNNGSVSAIDTNLGLVIHLLAQAGPARKQQQGDSAA